MVWLGIFLPFVGLTAFAVFLVWFICVMLYFVRPQILADLIHRLVSMKYIYERLMQIINNSAEKKHCDFKFSRQRTFAWVLESACKKLAQRNSMQLLAPFEIDIPLYGLK